MRECVYDRIFFKLLIQRVSFAEVKIQHNSRGQIQKGLFILIGFGHNLTNSELDTLKVKDLLNTFFNVFKKAIDKVFLLRVFPDEKSKMSKSVLDIKGDVYLVSQFTLFSDCKKGNRPSFTKALPEHLAKPMYSDFLDKMTKKDTHSCQIYSGLFGEHMEIKLSLDGPVTIELYANSKGFIS